MISPAVYKRSRKPAPFSTPRLAPAHVDERPGCGGLTMEERHDIHKRQAGDMALLVLFTSSSFLMRRPAFMKSHHDKLSQMVLKKGEPDFVAGAVAD